jgi:peptide-methionine (S)-S-oxide reductase
MLTLSRTARWLAPLALVASLSAAALAQTTPAPPPAAKSGGAIAVATFAGGCFWCVEEAFEKVPGVIRAVSGYIGGTVEKPTYEQVSAKITGHYEAVQVTYDPGKVSYPQLVDWFWRNIDPVDARGQFCDKGSPYYTAIFTHDDAQRKVAEETKQALEASGRFKGEKIATKVLPATAFWPAEDYHQDYYKKNPHRYSYYKTACGRAQRLEQIWGPPKPPQTLTQ